MFLRLFQFAQVVPEAAASTPLSRDDAMREGMTLLMMFSLLGVLVVSMLALLVVQRSARRKQAKAQRVPTDVSVDAWAEAGRRLDDSMTEFDEEL